MTPYYQDDHVTIYHGDCRDVAPHVCPDDGAAMVTDPPYGIGYQPYNHRPIVGDNSTALAEWAVTYWHPRTLVMFGANHYAPSLPVPGAWSCWDKRCHERADRMFGSPFELIWHNTRDRPGRMFRLQHGGVVNADGAGVRRVHPTQKPVLLMRWVIDPLIEPVIVDPFMGSGTTLRAAKDLGRRAIGIEVDERYCEIAARRMSQEVLDLGGAA